MLCFGLLSGAIFLLFLYRNGLIDALLISKRDLVDKTDISYLLLMWMVTIWSSISLVYGGNKLKFFVIVVLALSVLLGNRTPVVICGITVLVFLSLRKGKVSLFKNYGFKYLFIGAFSIVTVSLMKPFYTNFRAGQVGEFFSLIREEGLVNTIYRGLEFSRTQFIFNEIIINNFSTSGGHVVRGFLSLLPIPRGLYTTPSNEFNALFQPALFPDHDSGLANNIQAEFYAGFGYLGVFFSAIFVSSLVVFLQKMVNKLGGVERVICCLIGVLISFYSFRNSVGVTFGFVRLVIWPYFFFFVIYHMLRRLR